MKLCKLLLAAVGASALLGMLVSTASARLLEVSNQSFSSAYSSAEFHLPGATTRCHLTVEGSFHSRTLDKTLAGLIGYITSSIIGPCLSGTATILRGTLPWHVHYFGFGGRLPSIAHLSIPIIGFAYRVRESGGIACLARSSTGEPVMGRLNVDASGHATSQLEGSIRTGLECFGISGSFRSDAPRIVLQGTTVPISIRLI